MEMASSEVEMSSCQTFNCVLTRPHERCTRGGDTNNKKKNNSNNNNNVRDIPVVFEKNLNVFVRDHLGNCNVDGDNSTKPESKTEESRHEVPSLSSLGSDPDPNFGQPENPSRNETMAASSLVQIWEARTAQQPPSSNQSQFQIDNRTTSTGTNLSEHSESPDEESVKASELIQPIEEGNNEEEKEEMECDSQFVPPPPELGEKEREGVRVMDIIRKLSSDPEVMTNNDNGSSSNDNSKEVQTTEARCFPQVACSPRIRGRQALADLLEQMTRGREKELACIAEHHNVSKFTHRGRIQSTLRIRCYERCIAIQDSHRAKSSASGSDLNRSPRGSGVMHLLREKKYKANTENSGTGTVSSWGRIVDKGPHKATEKKVLQEPKEKGGLKEAQEVDSAVETSKKAVLSEIAENKNVLKKSVEETNQKETAKGRAEKQETKDKPLTKESSEGKGEKRELIKERAIAKESVEGNAMIGIAEKLNHWNSEEKINRRNGMEKGKANTDRVEKNVVLEEATRRIIKIESAERSITTSRENMMTPCEFTEKVRRKNKENCVSVEPKSKEIEDRNNNPQRVTTQADSCLDKQSSEETVLQGRTAKSDLKKPVEKESREEKPNTEKSVEESPLMGIAEKVNMWNSKEKKNTRKAMEKDEGKIEGKANTETNQVLQEASRRISNLETAERSIVTSREVVETVVGEKEAMDRRESSGDITQREYVEKGRRKKNEDTMSVEAKSKEVVEVKSMNPQAAKRVRDYEKNYSQHREETLVLRNSEAKSTKEIVRTRSQEVTQKEDFASHGSRERDKEKSSSQHNDETSFFRSSEANSTKEIVRNTSQEVTKREEPVSPGSKERDKEKSSSQYDERILILRNSEAKTTRKIERSNSQEVRKEEKPANEVSRESAKENNSSQQGDEVSSLRYPNDQMGVEDLEDEETKIVEHEETEEDVKEETLVFVNDDWDENEMEEDEYENYDSFYGENMDDWIQDISRPRSYWEDLRKERYLEVLNTKSDKKEICNLIERRTVSNFLTSDLRQRIDNLMITRVQGNLGVKVKEEDENEDGDEEEEWEVECSARNEDNNETEEETVEKTNLETVSDICSQSSARSSTIMSWTFKDQDIDKDQEPTMSLSLPEPTGSTNQSTQKTQETSDLRSQIEQLQLEVLELRSAVKTCIDMQLHFKNSITQDPSRSGSSAQQQVDTTKDPLKRKCCVCSEMPVDSLLYRCGHMCTCLKCAHELQWSSKKCPICMAPIVDVVRAFLDA